MNISNWLDQIEQCDLSDYGSARLGYTSPHMVESGPNQHNVAQGSPPPRRPRSVHVDERLSPGSLDSSLLGAQPQQTPKADNAFSHHSQHFTRRKRRKTRNDRYDPEKRSKAKAARIGDHSTRRNSQQNGKKRKKNDTLINHHSKSDNKAATRLTLAPVFKPTPGLFRRGIASIPARAKRKSSRTKSMDIDLLTCSIRDRLHLRRDRIPRGVA
ncbi:hypothetical protein K461DRAFT_81813 [Myriangium duriaei CBS 260.36]|uniref:Uncharacterized protein n=1 Tax=Myriangium duriaei CBS 260.36 TaxID=1168546 RepID=A0A9P4J5J5_9PEZI|nr:hypothetical protein K461DRAFT_81813 [Myriangium duriaei CBS 260.36]